MPYIPHDERYLFEHDLPVGASAGQVNYAITRMVDSWIGKGITYDRINAAIGVLECIKLELYRKVVANYEDQKERVNGGVYMERANR